MRVRLMRKLAERLDGIDLSGCEVGEELNLSPRKASLLVAEGWGLILAERRRHDSPRRQLERRRQRLDE